MPTGASGINKAPVMLSRAGAPPPGTAMRRGMGTAGGGAARPMTAVSGAGYNSRQTSMTGEASTIVLDVKVETEEDKLKTLEKNVALLAKESCFAAEEHDEQAVTSSSVKLNLV